MIIGVTGYFGTGKSTLARMLIDRLADHSILGAFADELKADVHTIYADILGPEWDKLTPERLEELKPDCLGLLYQGHGEMMRQIYGLDYWIVRYYNRGYKKGLINVIHDCRYPNEAQWVKDNGGIVVGVLGPNRRAHDNRDPNHASEREVPQVMLMANHVYDNSGHIGHLEEAANNLAQEAWKRAGHPGSYDSTY